MHREVRGDGKLLVNHSHAAPPAFERILWPIGLPVEGHGSGIRLKRTGEDFHQCAFAGAVFTDQRVHFSGADPKVDIVQCDCCGEALADALHFEAVVVRSFGHRMWRMIPSPGIAR